MRDEKLAIYLIRNYEYTMDDPWRNDFADDPIKEDAMRYDILLEELKMVLGCDLIEAERFFDQHYY